ncbi:flagellar hook-associated protein 3 FlgL [Alkalihalobacillus xiaoxiensis]|uniref:Flagellar hook-associated protein 3 FlgL n=1 Tax=Shouchella xiaoxiensis TaxID=766895 RepID=A0ABS2SY34_9BACI|nr:flagellar hook-associated protein FlgL [Shouchella xiaoxiensis]MBM7840438.1 flagellar hook-associated protein 3 FlgL [Shouchella xiaoxiensis]
MRITQSMLTANTMKYSQASYERLSTLQNQMSTQKKITRFSQDPVVAAKSMQFRESLSHINQYKRNLSEAHTRLDQSDTSLRETSNILTRAKELVVKAATDTYGEDERKSIAEELNQLRQHLVTVANTNSAGKYVFNGIHSKQAPLEEMNLDQVVNRLENGEDLSGTSISYGGELYVFEEGVFSTRDGNAQLELQDGQFSVNGETIRQEEALVIKRAFDQSTVEIELQQGVYVPVNADGHRLFSEDLFHDLFTLEQALKGSETTGTDLDPFISKIDDHLKTAADVNGQLGARMNRVDLMEDRLSHQELLMEKLKSENEDVDFEETVMKLLVAEGIHSAALAASARVIQPSLLDFLR